MGIIQSTANKIFGTTGTIYEIFFDPQFMLDDFPKELFNGNYLVILIQALMGNKNKAMIANLEFNISLLPINYLITLNKQIATVLNDLLFFIPGSAFVKLTLTQQIIFGLTIITRIFADPGTIGTNPDGSIKEPFSKFIWDYKPLPEQCRHFGFLSTVWPWKGLDYMIGCGDGKTGKGDKGKDTDVEKRNKDQRAKLIKEGYVYIEDARAELWKMDAIKHGSSKLWKFPGYKIFTAGDVKSKGYGKAVRPAAWFSGIPSSTSADEKYYILDAILDKGNYEMAQNLIKTMQKRDYEKRFGGKQLPPDPRDGILRSTWKGEFIKQFKDHYPKDLGTGEETIVYDDRYIPYKLYKVTISPIFTRLPPAGLPLYIYREMAELMVSGKQKEYMKIVVSEEKKKEPPKLF